VSSARPNTDDGAPGGPTPDPRGHMHRRQRLMPDIDSRKFVKVQKVAHVGTVDAAGWPYVLPLIYIYEGSDRIYFHTGNHRGHLLRNIDHDPRVCLEVAEMGAVHQGQPFACNSALVFTTVIVLVRFARARDNRAKKTWFFDQILSKYGRSNWTFSAGYPLLTASFCTNYRWRS
jgi:nitroimidazol reductase NimA-like FMN-containing flavoprotein (pyridoxamine 5'-phosphate oxidase superfamily)